MNVSRLFQVPPLMSASRQAPEKSVDTVDWESRQGSTARRSQNTDIMYSTNYVLDMFMMQKPNFNEQSRCIVTQVDPYLPDGAHMLVIDDLPAELILEGWKTREVRGKRTSYVGERIFLTLTGGKGEVVGTAKIKSCDGPLTEEEFHRQRFEHFVVGNEMPYKNTFTYQLPRGRRDLQVEHLLPRTAWPGVAAS